VEKSGLTVHKEIYKQQKNIVHGLIKKAKTDFYNKKFEECTDQKELFKILGSLTKNNSLTQLPVHDSLPNLLSEFNTFFKTKIEKIRESLNDYKTRPLTTHIGKRPSVSFSEFKLLSTDEIKKLVMAAPCKSCNLDPIPTQLLKEIIDVLAATLQTIVNASLQTATVPQQMKVAHVTPLLKKATLDSNILKNYRPISNLSFTSKLVERAADSQLSTYLTAHNLLAPTQSAYRQYHSVETALLKVQNDILHHVDNSEGVLLVLLDLSAAFDTIDHRILLNRLEIDFSITDQALAWHKSYLTKRSQVITLKHTHSKPTFLEFGVPQGSVIGPKDFIMYTRPIYDIAQAHDVCVMLYADDTQLYVPFTPNNSTSLINAIAKMESCIIEISAWMSINKLKLNEEKTEFIIMTPPKFKSIVQNCTLKVGTSEIKPVEHVRNLGVMFHQTMSVKMQITSLCKSTNFHLRNIGRIRKYLNTNATSTLVHSLISSRIDNNNSLLAGAPKCEIDRLQRLQNTAARIITRTPKCDHITRVLHDLHWLPVDHRIVFKILLLVYKCLNDSAPVYLKDLLQQYIPTRSLRSKDQQLLTIPKYRLKKTGDRTFAFVAPTMWNSLPHNIKTADSITAFKRLLKTHLFKSAYEVLNY
jgi:hypothetical protein